MLDGHAGEEHGSKHRDKVENERRSGKETERRTESKNEVVNITVKRGREPRGRTTNTIGREAGEIEGGTRNGTCAHSATPQCLQCHAAGVCDM